MNFGLTLDASRYSSVDVNAVKNITKQIFEKAEAKAAGLEQYDLTKFKRVDQGVDLYSSQTSQTASQQIAVRNAGLDVNLNQNFIANLAYLNTQAAKATFEAPQKSAETGKLQFKNYIDGLDVGVSIKEIFTLPNNVHVAAAFTMDKDKKGSSFLGYSNSNSNKSKEDSQNAKSNNIFSIIA